MVREKILHKATDMFLTYGFKSVTMDDIANTMGISKKTIYTYYKNKTKLVEASTLYLFETISQGICVIQEQEVDAIAELFGIRTVVMQHLKDEKSSPQYQLQKYYPNIYGMLQKRQFDVVKDCIQENIDKGIREGHYRPDISRDFVAKIYFACLMALKDSQLFPIDQYAQKDLMNLYLEYHIRAIVTLEGLKILETIIDNDKPS